MTPPGDWVPRVVAVVGAGTLGLTASHAALAAGARVTLLVRGADQENRGETKRAAVAASLDHDVAQGRISAERATELMHRLRITDDPHDLAEADIVLEALPEDRAIKQRMIAEIESVVAPDCVIASSTSSIPAQQLAAGARQPERVLVAHYVWPAHRMPLVEVACHADTSPRARARLAALLQAQQKTVVEVADRPGFLITRGLLAYWNEAIQLVGEGFEPLDIDTALEDFGFPLGPLRMMDRAGVRTAWSVSERYADSVPQAFPALTRLRAIVERGLTGFYDHGPRPRRPIAQTALVIREGSPTATGSAPMRRRGRWDRELIIDRALSALSDEVALAVAQGVVGSFTEACRAIDLAYGFPSNQGGLEAWSSHRLAPNVLQSAS